jgi:hypothetical protein
MTLKEAIDRSNPNTIADAYRVIKLGTTLMQDVKQTIRRRNIHVTDGVSLYDGTTLDTIQLPDDCKAGRLLMVRTLASGVVVQEYTLDANDTTPITLHAAIQPTGNIGVLSADAVTSIDIEFMPVRGDMFEVTLPVVASFLTLPAVMTTPGVVYLCQCEAMSIGGGGLIGRKVVLTPGAGAPAAGQCRLDLAKATVQFAAADLVTSARVRCLCSSAADLFALLQGSTPDLI